VTKLVGLTYNNHLNSVSASGQHQCFRTGVEI